MSLFSDKIDDFNDETPYTEDKINKQIWEELFEMERIFNTEILENYRAILSDWIPKGASIAIAVNDTFVYFASGHANIALHIGSKVPENSIAYQVIHGKRKIDAMMETTLFETPYYAIGYPITLNQNPAALVIVLPPLFQPQQNLLQLITGRDENEDYIPVSIEEVQYFESLQKKTWFYRNGEQLKTNITLKELQTRLPENFIRIHRSYIVNIKSIKSITKDFAANFIVHLKNGVELPVSQSYANSLKQLLEI